MDRVGEGEVYFCGGSDGEFPVLEPVVEVVEVDVFYWFVAIKQRRVLYPVSPAPLSPLPMRNTANAPG